MKTRTWVREWSTGAVAVVALLAGCGKAPPESSAAAQPLEATFQDFGDYEVHYNALRTDALTPEPIAPKSRGPGALGQLLIAAVIALGGYAAWLYFLHPAGAGLSERRAYSYRWGYGHYGLFAALAALGAGRRDACPTRFTSSRRCSQSR